MKNSYTRIERDMKNRKTFASKNNLSLHFVHVDLRINEVSSVHRGHNASAKSIESGQPAQFAQAVLSRNCLLLVNCLHIIGTYYPMIRFDC